jgi:hypothetical protein
MWERALNINYGMLRNCGFGFTPEDFLMSIAIIGILAALLLSALWEAKTREISLPYKNNLYRSGLKLVRYVDIFPGNG